MAWSGRTGGRPHRSGRRCGGRRRHPAGKLGLMVVEVSARLGRQRAGEARGGRGDTAEHQTNGDRQHGGGADHDDDGPQDREPHDPIDAIGLSGLADCTLRDATRNESIWPVYTLYRGRRALMKPLNAELAARAWEFAQGLDLEEYRPLQGEVPNAWPATAKRNGVDFDRAFLAFIAERWLDKAA